MISFIFLLVFTLCSLYLLQLSNHIGVKKIYKFKVRKWTFLVIPPDKIPMEDYNFETPNHRISK